MEIPEGQGERESRNHLERRLGSLGAYRARQALATRTLDGRAGRVEHGPKTPEQAPPVAPATAAAVVEPLLAAVRCAMRFPSRAELEAAEQRAEEGIKVGIAAREAKQALLIRAAQHEREAVDLVKPLLRTGAIRPR